MRATARAALDLRNVLFATDFSPCSERALLHAVAVAHHYGSTLHVAHVVKPGVFCMVPPEGYMATSEAEIIAMKLAHADAQDLASRALKNSHCEDIAVRTWVNLGVVGETLCSIIQREHIDLVVVGSHARTGLRKIVLGSVAEEIFRSAPCPVLTVGPNSWRSDPQVVHLRRILFPTDFSPDSARALPIAVAVAEKFRAPITVLHVVDRLDATAANGKQKIAATIKERMVEMVSCFSGTSIHAELSVEFGDVGSSVVAAANRLGADLIAFGLKSPDTYADRLPWMHAYKVVCEAMCPVLSLKGESSRP